MLIAIICVIYYIIGWVIFASNYSKIEDEGFGMEIGSAILCTFGLYPIIFIPYFIREYFKQNKKTKLKFTIEVINNKVSDKDGIVFSNESSYRNEGKQYTYYNFPEENYAGKISINIKEIDSQTLDKIIGLLNQWAENQKRKNARVKAYQSL